LGLLISSLLGMIIVVLLIKIRTVLLTSYMYPHLPIIEVIRTTDFNPFWHSLNWTALAIHLWLPLFALGVVMVRLMDWIVRSAAKLQLFLKDGPQHPLDASGT
jgi:hypothetical protein